MGITIGVRFLFAKVRIYKGFPILFNDNRLHGDRFRITMEPLSFCPSPFNEKSVRRTF